MGNSKNFSNVCRLKYHYVYQTKNLLNGKTYIGRHSTNNLNDGYIGSGTLLKRSIKKYGKENFVCTILSFFDSYEESVEEEKWLVHKDYCKNENNYNIVEGGSNPIMYGEMNPAWKGGVKRVLKDRRTLKGLENHRFGKKHKLESVQKAVNTKKEKGLLKGIIVDDILYESLAECGRVFNINECTVSSRCISPHFTNWKFQDEKYGKEKSEKYYEKVKNRHERKKLATKEKQKPIFSVNGVEYFVFKDAERILNCHTETIQKRCIDENYTDWYFLTQELIDKYKPIVLKRLEKESVRARGKKKK